jgi:hypothetical protein
MTLEQGFVAASVIVGIAQVIDAVVLRRRQGIAGGFAICFSVFEHCWFLLCVYTLLNARDAGAQVLAMLFIVNMMLAWVITLTLNPRFLNQPPDSFKIPPLLVFFGGFYGVVYSIIAAIYLFKYL